MSLSISLASRAVLLHQHAETMFIDTELGITRSIAKQHALLRGELAHQGQSIDQPDIFIAATAIHHDLTLVTRNLKDYDRIPRLVFYKPAA